MVRLERQTGIIPKSILDEFTFQYGQIRKKYTRRFYKVSRIIYIPVWLDQKDLYKFLKDTQQKYLHSSMVRLES